MWAPTHKRACVLFVGACVVRHGPSLSLIDDTGSLAEHCMGSADGEAPQAFMLPTPAAEQKLAGDGGDEEWVCMFGMQVSDSEIG